MEKFKQIVSDVLDIDISKISNDLKRDDVEKWDSLGHLILMSEIEKKMKVSLTMKEIQSIRTFQQLVEIIQSKKSGMAG